MGLDEPTLIACPDKRVHFGLYRLQDRYGSIEDGKCRVQPDALLGRIFRRFGQALVDINCPVKIGVPVARVARCILQDPVKILHRILPVLVLPILVVQAVMDTNLTVSPGTVLATDIHGGGTDEQDSQR